MQKDSVNHLFFSRWWCLINQTIKYQFRFAFICVCFLRALFFSALSRTLLHMLMNNKVNARVPTDKSECIWFIVIYQFFWSFFSRSLDSWPSIFLFVFVGQRHFCHWCSSTACNKIFIWWSPFWQWPPNQLTLRQKIDAVCMAVCTLLQTPHLLQNVKNQPKNCHKNSHAHTSFLVLVPMLLLLFFLLCLNVITFLSIIHLQSDSSWNIRHIWLNRRIHCMDESQPATEMKNGAHFVNIIF